MRNIINGGKKGRRRGKRDEEEDVEGENTAVQNLLSASRFPEVTVFLII